MSDISTLSNLLLTQSLISNNETTLDSLTRQLSTGTKGVSLEDYGEQAPQLLNLQGNINTLQGYIANNTNVSTYLKAYDSSLSEITTDATDLQGKLAALNLTDTATVTGLETLANGILTDIGATLNVQAGNRYLYSGTRYNTAPVDFSKLTPLTAPAAFTPITSTSTPDNLPAYDTQAPNDPTGEAWATQKVAIGDNNVTTYGITSNDPAIQQLVYAIQSIQAGTTSTGTTQQQYLSNATSALQSAIAGLQTLQSKNGTEESLVSNATTAQQTTLTTLQSQSSGITNVDSATVATEITSVQNQLNATYKVTASLLNLSLLNYLPNS